MSLDSRLLVAGEDTFRSEVLRVLGEFGAVEATSVEQAAASLLSFRPMCALVDLRSVDGFAICRRIKGAAATRLLPVLAFTDDTPVARVAALDGGADHVLAF